MQVEAELLDSMSGERLAAVIDKRVGGASFEGQFDKWDDVKNSCDEWAKGTHDFLLKKRRSG